MKCLLLPLIAVLALAPAVNAKIDLRINERCVGSAENKGCVELNTEIVTLPKCDSYRKNNCTGELRYTNAFYVGEISNGKEHGFGTMNWAGGDKYVGQWVNGERDGQGTYYWATGDKYVGQFKNSKSHGSGTYTNSGGDSWTGEWRWGEKTKNGSHNKPAERDSFYYPYLR